MKLVGEVPWHRNQAGPDRVFVLPMTSASRDQVPAILLNQLDNLGGVSKRGDAKLKWDDDDVPF